MVDIVGSVNLIGSNLRNTLAANEQIKLAKSRNKLAQAQSDRQDRQVSINEQTNARQQAQFSQQEQERALIGAGNLADQIKAGQVGPEQGLRAAIDAGFVEPQTTLQEFIQDDLPQIAAAAAQFKAPPAPEKFSPSTREVDGRVVQVGSQGTKRDLGAAPEKVGRTETDAQVLGLTKSDGSDELKGQATRLDNISELGRALTNIRNQPNAVGGRGNAIETVAGGLGVVSPKLGRQIVSMFSSGNPEEFDRARTQLQTLNVRLVQPIIDEPRVTDEERKAVKEIANTLPNLRDANQAEASVKELISIFMRTQVRRDTNLKIEPTFDLSGDDGINAAGQMLQELGFSEEEVLEELRTLIRAQQDGV